MNSLTKEQRFALLFLLAGGLSAGFAAIFTRLCAFPATVIASFRLLVAGLVLLPFCWADLPGLFRERGLKRFLLLMLPGILLGLHFQLWVLGIKRTYVASGTFIFAVNPLFFALASRLLSRRRIGGRTFVCLGMVAAGAAWLLVAGQGRLGQWGDLYCFLSMLLYVAYLLVSRRVSRGTRHLTYIHVIYLWGGILTLPFALIGGDIRGLDFSDSGSLAALFALALLPTLVGHTAANYGVRHFSPLTVSFFTQLEPVFATLAAVPILGETPLVGEIPAYLLFFTATLLYLAGARREGGY
jgi:drug/metabolite transporter (DMT)-like permease